MTCSSPSFYISSTRASQLQAMTTSESRLRPNHRGYEHDKRRYRQTQYKSYQCEIQIYHYRANIVSVSELASVLTYEDHGLVEDLLGPDLLAADHYVPPGDQVPSGLIEAAYLPGVFPDPRLRKEAGAAIGFRIGNNTIRWLSFNRAVDDSIINRWIWDRSTEEVEVHYQPVPANYQRRLFDLVAYMPKGIVERRARGCNQEHKQWHDSLWEAKEPTVRSVKIKVKWKNFGIELKEQHRKDREAAELARAEAERARQEAEDEEERSDESQDGKHTRTLYEQQANREQQQ
jgi:hypothetical protein